jgi:Flp pilus assembly protein TadB
MPMTIVVAGVAAVAILLIALGIATSGRGSGISSRLERYASGKEEAAKVSTGQGGIADLLAQSAALSNLNKVVEQRDFGANLARDIARADLKLKPSEFLAIWIGSIIGLPFLFIVASLGLPALRSPLAILVGAFLGFFLPRFWLNRRKNGRRRRVQQAARHDHAAGQRPPGRLVVPPEPSSSSSASRGRRCRPIQPGHP